MGRMFWSLNRRRWGWRRDDPLARIRSRPIIPDDTDPPIYDSEFTTSDSETDSESDSETSQKCSVTPPPSTETTSPSPPTGTTV